MGEEISNTVNLDLNLVPDPEVSLEPDTNNAAADLSGWANGLFNRDSEPRRRFRRIRHRSRFRHINILPALAETHSPAIELSQLLISSANGAALPAGEGRLAGGERVSEDSKKCENGNKVMEEDNVTQEKRVIEKSGGSEGSFFDCYICLDLSKEPVVTNCGHLYCWSCLYRWLQVSEAKECPVCKGEVSVKTLTPIYGRGRKRESEEVPDTKIPSRPQARRIESLRTTLERSGYIATEMIRQDGLERESSTGERRARAFLNRFMTSRGVRAEQNQSSAALVAPIDDISDTDLASSIAPENERESGHLRDSTRDMSFRRQIQAHRALRMSFSPVLTFAERLEDAYWMELALWRNQEQNNIPSVGGEDRDSYSSIIGVINSDSQVDTAAEIDSMVTVSTSSSVRRPFLNRFMTSRGDRTEQNQSSAALVAPIDDISDTDLALSIAPENERESGQLRDSTNDMSFLRQIQAHRALRMPFSPVLTFAERLEDAYWMERALWRNQEQNNIPSVGGEDRDSFSSIIGVINSESQVDTAAEIDSMVTVSTSSSVRRPHENSSRVSDVDSADSLPLRRRRRLA